MHTTARLGRNNSGWGKSAAGIYFSVYFFVCEIGPVIAYHKYQPSYMLLHLKSLPLLFSSSPCHKQPLLVPEVRIETATYKQDICLLTATLDLQV